MLCLMIVVHSIVQPWASRRVEQRFGKNEDHMKHENLQTYAKSVVAGDNRRTMAIGVAGEVAGGSRRRENKCAG